MNIYNVNFISRLPSTFSWHQFPHYTHDDVCHNLPDLHALHELPHRCPDGRENQDAVFGPARTLRQQRQIQDRNARGLFTCRSHKSLSKFNVNKKFQKNI